MGTNQHPGSLEGISSQVGKILGQAQLTTSGVAIVTVPANSSVDVSSAVVTNITGGAITFTGHVIPSGGTLGPTNAVEFARSIAANTAVKLDSLVGLKLGPGDKISALASANTSLNLTISGYAFS